MTLAASTRPRVAAVFCVHHKPWLIMSTLITTLAQRFPGLDLHFLYNVGIEGQHTSPHHREYQELIGAFGQTNSHLDPYDGSVKEVCDVAWPNVRHWEYENDQGLDSGAWYKFIRGGAWREYDYVFFLGEGALFARPHALQAIVDFAESSGAQFIASGHEKRRLSRRQFLPEEPDLQFATPMERFSRRMIRESFEIFARDPDFRGVFDKWDSVGPRIRTENHVPDIWGRAWPWRRLINAATGSYERVGGTGVRGQIKRAVIEQTEMLLAIENACAPVIQRTLGPFPERIHVDGALHVRDQVVEVVEKDGVRFHREQTPEWLGCGVIHLLGNRFLETLDARMTQYQMYEVLDLPFAASGLEVIWGFLPSWLGFEKWFTDGIHRVRKNFVTHRREDDAAGMAWYINRYYEGLLQVVADGEHIKLRRLSPQLASLPDALNHFYRDE